MPSNIFSDQPLDTVTTPLTVFVTEALVVVAGFALVVVVAGLALVVVVVVVVETIVFRSWLAKPLIFSAAFRKSPASVAALVGAAAVVDMISSGCRNVKGTSTKGMSVVKACGSAFFAALALAVTVTASAVIVTTLLADNGTPFVSDVADVALAVDVVFTDATLDVAEVAVDVALDGALGVEDVALVADTGGTTAGGADVPQKSAPVPHLPFVEH